MNRKAALLSILLSLSIIWQSTLAKSLASDTYYNNQGGGTPIAQSAQSGAYQQQASNSAQYPQHGSYQSPSYPEYDDNMESYEYPSSEEIMPVKNSQFVPVEMPGDSDNVNATGGHIPQRQVDLQQFWQQHMLGQQQNNGNNPGVIDEGNIEVVSIPVNNNNNYNYNQANNYNPGGAGASLSQYYQQQQQQQVYQPVEEEQPIPPPSSTSSPPPPPPVPTPKKKSNVHKLVVEARRTGDGKIAVVKDKMRAARQRRSMMTLSREDENDSEYDDLGSSEKLKVASNRRSNSTIVNVTEKLKF